MTALDQYPSTTDEKKEGRRKKKKRRWMSRCTFCTCLNPNDHQKTTSSPPPSSPANYSVLLKLTKVKESLTEKNGVGGGKSEKGLLHSLSKHAVIFLRGLFPKATKKSRRFPKDSKSQVQAKQHEATPSLPPRPLSPDLKGPNSSTAAVISPESHLIKVATRCNSTLSTSLISNLDINTKVNKPDTVVGLSVLTIILLALGSSGRGFAIVLTSALFYLISFVKATQSETDRSVEVVEEEGE